MTPNDLDPFDQGQPKTIGFLPSACLTNVPSLNKIGWTVLEFSSPQEFWTHSLTDIYPNTAYFVGIYNALLNM
jgi:hypothetical protein